MKQVLVNCEYGNSKFRACLARLLSLVHIGWGQLLNYLGVMTLHAPYFVLLIWRRFLCLSRFISGNFSPTQIVLKENSRMRKERWIHFDKVENEARLCSVPYHKDFKLVSGYISFVDIEYLCRIWGFTIQE